MHAVKMQLGPIGSLFAVTSFKNYNLRFPYIPIKTCTYNTKMRGEYIWSLEIMKRITMSICEGQAKINRRYSLENLLKRHCK